MVVVAAGREYQKLATNSFDEQMTASPVIVGEVIYLRTFQALYAVKKLTAN